MESDLVGSFPWRWSRELSICFAFDFVIFAPAKVWKNIRRKNPEAPPGANNASYTNSGTYM